MNTAGAVRLALGAAAMLIAGCAPLAPRKPPAPPLADAASHALVCVQDWALQGRVAFRVPDQSGSFRLRWEQHGATYRLNAEGPLGTGGARVEGDAGNVVVESRGERREYQAAPEAVLASMLGYPLPVRSLRYWALGVPDPTAGPAQWRVQSDQRVLEQAGWTVRYETMDHAAGAIPLPARLRLEREGSWARLLVERWDLDPAQLCREPL
ncbi:MAG TPA: lipoprotein insertase outer membrane protein LolB [Candidatus Acidoferrales bacterium]|nr:lipoprotein insertase outer membrane protein LolB [Candidatus Acidoferrales bacterium]